MREYTECSLLEKILLSIFGIGFLIGFVICIDHMPDWMKQGDIPIGSFVLIIYTFLYLLFVCVVCFSIKMLVSLPINDNYEN